MAAGEKAINLSPENSNYHLWLGRAYGEKPTPPASSPPLAWPKSPLVV